MDTLFDFEEQPQEPKPLKDWSGNEMPTRHLDSSNPMVRAYGFGPDGKKCKDCAFLLRDEYHNVTYFKCEKRGVTRGKGTDHRVRYEACSKFEQEQPEPPNQPYTEICPQCKGPIKVLYTWGVWACPKCNIKIAQTREEGITRIEPMLKFGISPLERSKEQ
jgi:ribosomal protein L37AE/L43A